MLHTTPGARPPAVVMDADKLSQIAIIQDLGRRGVPVVAIAQKPTAIGFRSRYVSRAILAPVPSHETAFAEFLLAKAPRGVLFYSNDANAEMLARHSRELREGGFDFCISDSTTLESLIHKDRLCGTAARCGVKVPRSLLVSAADAGAACAQVGFPCILKSTNLAGGVYELVAGGGDVDPALRRIQAVVTAEEWRHRAAKIMVQQWIPQDGVTLWNFNALARDGEIVSYSMGVRIRTDVRPDGAIGSMLLYGRTAQNAAVLEANRRLLRHVRYDGILETEWSQSGDGEEQLYLYDFNPRPSGNFRWTLKSGVPMALQYYELSLGLRPDPGSAMTPGVAYWKILGRQNDFLWALRNPRLTARDKFRVLVQDAAALLRPWRHAIEILDTSDLGPTAAACRELLSYCWGEAARACARRFRKPFGRAMRRAAA